MVQSKDGDRRGGEKRQEERLTRAGRAVKSDREYGAINDPRRILILSLCYWPEKAGGAPPVQQMAEALALGGARVSVLTTRPSYPEIAVFPEYRDDSRDRETHQGVTIRPLAVPPQPGNRKVISVLKSEGIFALKAWWSLLRQPRPLLHRQLERLPGPADHLQDAAALVRE
jgi:hypothetical protein